MTAVSKPTTVHYGYIRGIKASYNNTSGLAEEKEQSVLYESETVY